MEALIIFDCSNYSKSLVDVLKVFQHIGWQIFNPQNKVEYLPVGDDDNYDWQVDEISESEVFDIISNKIALKEQVGINLYFSYGIEGVSLLAYDTKQIMLSLNINKLTVKDRYTDMSWYIENIIYKLLNYGVKISSYKIEEYEG